MAVNENRKDIQNKNTSNKDAQQRMHDNYSAMGQKGGNATKENHDENYYHEIGQKGGEARKDQMAHASSYTNQNEGKRENKKEDK